MRLGSAFLKLPLRFDIERLKGEAMQFGEADWEYHPQRETGNTALPLISVGGENNNLFEGEMKPTSALERCPYIQQVMAAFGTVVGRTRLMRLKAGCDVPAHSDGNYAWRNRLRIHIPIITHPEVIFSSVDNIDIHRAAGDAWTFDNWREHAVYNNSDVDRIHLVIDTVGSSQFWATAKSGWDPSGADQEQNQAIKYYPFSYNSDDHSFALERFNSLPVRSPDEVTNMCNELLADLRQFERSSPHMFVDLEEEIELFKHDWAGYWARYWDLTEYIPQYQLLVRRLKTKIRPLLKHANFDSNRADVYTVAAAWITSMTNEAAPQRLEGSAPELKLDSTVAHSSTSVVDTDKAGSGLTLDEYIARFSLPAFEQPIFIVAAPRSGSTMLFEALQRNKGLWTIGDESQREVESIPSLHPANRQFASNELGKDDYTPQIGAQLMEAFMARLQNPGGTGYEQTPEEYQPKSIRFLEKTPKNSLRIAFFRAMFPDAKFIYLYRSARSNIGSIIDAWNSQKFVTYRNLPDWNGPYWSLLLPEGWRGMRGQSTAQVAAWQWAATNRKIMQDLSQLPKTDWTTISYETLIESPSASLQRLCQFAEIPFGPRMEIFAKQGFPQSRYTLTAPENHKWLRHEKGILEAEEIFLSIENEINEFH
jgi:hypothetical protein